MVDQLDKEANSIREQSIKMAWHMRGGATYDDILQMSWTERTSISELIKENMETTNKTRLPFF
jgi:hypothetical protein